MRNKLNNTLDKISLTFNKFFCFEGTLFRYSLGFSFLFALLPSIIIVFMFIKFSIIPLDTITNLLFQYLPESLIGPFIDYLTNSSNSDFYATTISLIVSSYLASRSFFSFMLIAAKDENIEYNPLLIRIKAVFLLLLFILAITISLSIIIALQSYIKYIPITTALIVTITLPIIFYFFYRFLSFKKRPLMFGLLGGVVSGLLIVIIGYYFLYYISEYTNYSTIYGPLASLVILIVSIHLICNVIYFGYCLNISFSDNNNLKNKHHNVYHKINKNINKLPLP